MTSVLQFLNYMAMQSLRSLLIADTHENDGDPGYGTGVWMEDLAAPYYVLRDAGECITIVSPDGGHIPVDASSPVPGSAPDCVLRFRQDPQALYHSTHMLPLNEVRKEDFDLVFLAGGYGALWNFPKDKRLQQLVGYFIRQQIPIGFVGHALAAMILLTRYDGRPLVAGRRLTAYSNEEQESSRWPEIPPLLLESKLVELGAVYSKGPMASCHVVTDRRLVTGQNRASATETARQVLLLARSKDKEMQFRMDQKIH